MRIGCILLIVLLAINLSIGGLCFDYALYSILGKDIPFYGDAIAGLFLGEIAIPLALVCWIVRLCGVPAPFVSPG